MFLSGTDCSWWIVAVGRIRDINSCDPILIKVLLRILTANETHVVLMHFHKLSLKRFKSFVLGINQLWRRGCRPASVETKGIVVRLREADGGQLRYFCVTQIFLEVDGGDVIYNVLTVVDSPGDVVVRVDRDGLDLQNNVELLTTLLGSEVPAGLELPADDLRVLPRHDLNTGVDPTLTIAQAQFSFNVLATTVWYCVASLGFTEEDTVSCCDDDERTRGARQDGGPAVVGLVLSASEGADPGISAPGVLKHGLGWLVPGINLFHWVELRIWRISSSVLVQVRKDRLRFSDLKLRPHWLGCGAPGINLFHLTELGVRRTSADSVLAQGRDSGLVLRRSWHWGEISSDEKASLSCIRSCCGSNFH